MSKSVPGIAPSFKSVMRDKNRRSLKTKWIESVPSIKKGTYNHPTVVGQPSDKSSKQAWQNKITFPNKETYAGAMTIRELDPDLMDDTFGKNTLYTFDEKSTNNASLYGAFKPTVDKDTGLLVPREPVDRSKENNDRGIGGIVENVVDTWLDDDGAKGKILDRLMHGDNKSSVKTPHSINSSSNVPVDYATANHVMSGMDRLKKVDPNASEALRRIAPTLNVVYNLRDRKNELKPSHMSANKRGAPPYANFDMSYDHLNGTVGSDFSVLVHEFTHAVTHLTRKLHDYDNQELIHIKGVKGNAGAVMNPMDLDACAAIYQISRRRSVKNIDNYMDWAKEIEKSDLDSRSRYILFGPMTAESGVLNAIVNGLSLNKLKKMNSSDFTVFRTASPHDMKYLLRGKTTDKVFGLISNEFMSYMMELDYLGDLRKPLVQEMVEPLMPAYNEFLKRVLELTENADSELLKNVMIKDADYLKEYEKRTGLSYKKSASRSNRTINWTKYISY